MNCAIPTPRNTSLPATPSPCCSNHWLMQLAAAVVSGTKSMAICLTTSTKLSGISSSPRYSPSCTSNSPTSGSGRFIRSTHRNNLTVSLCIIDKGMGSRPRCPKKGAIMPKSPIDGLPPKKYGTLEKWVLSLSISSTYKSSTRAKVSGTAPKPAQAARIALATCSACSARFGPRGVIDSKWNCKKDAFCSGKFHR